MIHFVNHFLSKWISLNPNGEKRKNWFVLKFARCISVETYYLSNHLSAYFGTMLICIFNYTSVCIPEPEFIVLNVVSKHYWKECCGKTICTLQITAWYVFDKIILMAVWITFEVYLVKVYETQALFKLSFYPFAAPLSGHRLTP